MYLVIIMLFEFLNSVMEGNISECGGIISVPKELEDGCARAMANNSYVAENFGDKFESKFEPHLNKYYPNQLKTQKMC